MEKKIQRKRYDEKFRKKIVEEYSQSNLSLTKFSQLSKINISMISRWVKKYNGINVSSTSQVKNDSKILDDIVFLKQEIIEIKQNIEVFKTIIRKTFSEKYKMLIEKHPEN
jgi:transposase-like protein